MNKLDKQGSISFENLAHPMYATGIGLVIYGLEAEEQKARKATANHEEQPPTPVDPTPDNDDEAEQPAPAKKKEKKRERTKKIREDNNFRDTVTSFLTKIFTEEDLGE